MSAVRAPGKALLIGEYAVLDGAPAVVAAVDCFATARLSPEPPASPFIEAAVRESAAALGALGLGAPADRIPLVDTGSFSVGGRKLGVGSSAAATVAAVGALFHAAGLDLLSPEVRERVQATATAAHDHAQGVRGSGADVLAATWGGVCTLNVAREQALRGASGPGVRILFVPTSHSASTAQLVERYRAVHATAKAARDMLTEAARRFVRAWSEGEVPALLAAVAEAYEGYLRLGQALERVLVTPEHALIAKTARIAGGAAKPSGAGGGDLAVAFLPDDAAAKRFTDLLPPHLTPAALRVSSLGLHSFTKASQNTDADLSRR